ncbi:hypothetical protein ACHHYP_01788 [Achlya hypogyna]|uniref:Myb-like domain-containing protein n=1 Tax=Achlya hypogyna TaxID=1202772 RepID=A0A1V9ZT67_ACHHY|nr:hypothetical protein ACHHYP_01788 [Achlya hypogyna]
MNSPTEAAAKDASIASRTRTKVSLVDVDIEQLENDLADDPSYMGLDMDVIQEEENYRRFLTSLLPNASSDDDDLSFLCDDDDDEYHPHEEDDDEEDDDDDVHGPHRHPDMANSISKSELSGLLWDSSKIDFLPLPAIPTTTDEAAKPAEAPARPKSFVQIQPNRHWKGSLTKAQLTQLASQMHKHYQLLCQTTLLAAATPGASTLETAAMLADLQRRSEAVRAWKESVVSKLHPSDSAASLVLNARRVTRSFSAAHAAIVNPSMYEVHALHKPLSRLNITDDNRTEVLRTHLGALDYHLLHPAKFKPKESLLEVFTESEDRLLVHGVKRSGAKISWATIQKNFLPTKSTDDLRARYRFLSSAKAPQNPVKAFISSFPPRRVAPWLVEEEIRILRGMLAFGEDERRKFAKIATQLLPHRSRSEIRKRWGRMLSDMAPHDEAAGFTDELTPRERDVLRWQRALERKLEAKAQTQQLPAAKEPEASETTKVQRAKDDAAYIFLGSAAQCIEKHLHPALFYSPWAIAAPSLLLDSTCEHNWPASLPLKKKVKMALQAPVSDDWTSMAFPSDDDDSEFEVEELVSSSDDDDDDDDKPDAGGGNISDMDFEQVELDDDEADDEALFESPFAPPSVGWRMPLASERTLAALERRLSGRPPAPASSAIDRASMLMLLDDDGHEMEVEELEDDVSDDDDDEFECEELLPSSEDEAPAVETPPAPIQSSPRIDSAKLELLAKRMSQQGR